MEQTAQQQENNEKEEILYSTEGFLSKLNKWQAIICFFVFPALCSSIIWFAFIKNSEKSDTLTENILNSVSIVSLIYLFCYNMWGKCILLSTNKLTLTNKGIIYKTSKKTHYIPWNDISKVTKSYSGIFDKRNTDRTGCTLRIRKKDSNCVDIYLSGFKLDENFIKIFNEYIRRNNVHFLKKINKSFIDSSNDNCSWIPFFTILTIGFFPLLIFFLLVTS
ncbi:MAG: hypothetical protein E7090_03575 [Bacteroidales bacterium]|nr:hypothetical protein [Bacteroidales bacterium]